MKIEQMLEGVNNCLDKNGLFQQEDKDVRYCRILAPLPCMFRIDIKIYVDNYNTYFWKCNYEKR